MVVWIEKEVEASIMEIGPCFIDLLQCFCFKFDFLQFWTVKNFHLVVAMELYVSCRSRHLPLLIENVVQR